MKDAQLTVATFGRIEADPERAHSKHAAVWYLGDDYARLQALREMWPAARFGPVAEAVAIAAEALLPLILDLDGYLANPDLDRDAWDASDLAERSRYSSPFFLELCRTKAVLEAATRGEAVLAVCDDDGFALAVFDAAEANGFAPGWQGMSIAAARLAHCAANIARAGKRLAAELRAAWRRLAVARRLRAASPLKADAARQVDVWMTIWATEKSFDAGAPLSRDDRFGTLPALLREAGLRVGYMVLPLWPERYAGAAASAVASAEPTLLLEDGYDIADVLRATFSALLPIRGVRQSLSWNGMDLSSVLRRALVRERLSCRSIQTRLFAGLARVLARLKASPKGVLFTYENHSWEKILSSALRRNLPGTRSVGYNHTPFPPLYVSFHPSPADIAANRIPDRVIMMGNEGQEAMVLRGFPAKRVSVGGGLRYADFFADVDRLPPPPAGERVALCCLGLDIDECVELSSKAAEAVGDVPGMSLWINFHPIATAEFRETLKAAILAKNDSVRIRFDDRSVRVLLPECHAILYVDTNAAFEAVAAGRQAIYVGRDTGLNYDKLPTSLSHRSLRTEQISAALYSGTVVDRQTARSILRKTFAPVRPEVFIEALTG